MSSVCRSTPLAVPLAQLAALIACVTLAACGSEDEFLAPLPVVASVDVTPQTATVVSFGWRVQLSATARDSSGGVIPGADVHWSSSAAAVATVDSSGLVAAVGNGCAAITAIADGATGTATIVVQQQAAYLDFVRHPMATLVGHVIAPAVEVTIKDLGGNTVSDATDTVTMAIGANPGSAVLGGTTTVAAVGGVASFADLTIDREASGYTLAATSPRLHGATSPAFDICYSLTRIDSLAVFPYYGYTYPPRSSDTLHIDRFRVAYAVSVSSVASTTLSAVELQSFIDQGAASRAAGGTPVMCNTVPGYLPPGTCTFNVILGASNAAAGNGTLVQGNATARFELRDGVSDTVLYSMGRPVTLVETAAPPLPQVRIDTVDLSSTSLTIGTRVHYTAAVINEESETLSRFGIQGWIDQGFVFQPAGGALVRCNAPVGDLRPGYCPFEFTFGVSSWGGVPGPATARFELRDYAHDRVVDTFFIPVRLRR